MQLLIKPNSIQYMFNVRLHIQKLIKIWGITIVFLLTNTIMFYSWGVAPKLPNISVLGPRAFDTLHVWPDKIRGCHWKRIKVSITDPPLLICMPWMHLSGCACCIINEKIFAHTANASQNSPSYHHIRSHNFGNPSLTTIPQLCAH